MRTKRESLLKEQQRLKATVPTKTKSAIALTEKISEFNIKRQRSQKWVKVARVHLADFINALEKALEDPEGW